jgi:hypothetical protein
MKKLLALCLLVFAATFVAACTQGGASSPVAPQTSNLTSVSNEARSNDYVFVCHNNVDGDDGDPAWVVISVNSTSVAKHCDNHGDFSALCSNVCDLSSFSVGDDCSSCVAI